jgi:hypothetical protein
MCNQEIMLSGCCEFAIVTLIQGDWRPSNAGCAGELKVLDEAECFSNPGRLRC